MVLGKRILFLIDDIWPAKDCDRGYLPKLRNILEGSPDSRIIFTTRNELIGSFASSHVDFDARSPLGPISKSIFMRYASNRCRDAVGEEKHNVASVKGILFLCASLPIALAVTGGFVSTQVSTASGFTDVCDTYFNALKEKSNWGGSILKSAIELSLEYLDRELSIMSDISPDYSMSQLYTSFSVLEK